MVDQGVPPSPRDVSVAVDENEPSMKLPPVVGRLERGEKTPICVIMVGMAGSGKTTLLTQLQRSLDEEVDVAAEHDTVVGDGATAETTTPPLESCYCVNLDPATLSMPYEVAIDIRDTVDYKQVMRQHKLGPNGAIMTCLNLFATKFDQVMSILEKRAYENNVTTPPSSEHLSQSDNTPTPTPQSDNSPADGNDNNNDDDDDDNEPMDYILVDTPGQIEVFTWSASGSIMSECLASAFPTVLCFVVDTVRCASSPNTFLSNMLYACSMLYRTRLPLIVCFNKTDVVSHEFCLEWMREYDVFQQAMDDVAESAGYYGSLTRSLSLVLDEFYSTFANACGVSAVTGDGIPEFWRTVQKAAREDFATDYIDDLKNRLEEQEARKRAMARHNIRRLQRDIDLEKRPIVNND